MCLYMSLYVCVLACMRVCLCACVRVCVCLWLLCIHDIGAVFQQIRTPGEDKVVCLAAFAGIHGISIASVRRLADVSL